MTRSKFLLACLIPATVLLGACGDDGSGSEESTDTDAMNSTGVDSMDTTSTDPTTGGSTTSDPTVAETGSDTDTEGETDTDGGELVVPEVYEFESRFEEGVSSVSYGGQSFRQVLISSLKAEMNLIQEEIDNDNAVFAAGEVAARLSFYVDFDGDSSSDVAHLIATTPAPLQTAFGDLGSGANLVDKIAGNDADPQHQDWSADMIGWDASDSPEDLVRDWIQACDDLAVAYSTEVPLDPDGVQIDTWFISPEGLDYQQLLQKFLLGAVNYSQGTDDYLDDASDNGLNSDNTESDGGDPYTVLEHAWDEGFGYWGGARNYLEYTDDEIATADGRPEYVDGYNDYDADGAIDLQSEINFSASVNAGKRDRGAAELGAATDFTEQTMQAFLTGRAIITHANGALSDEDMMLVQEQRDLAVDGWERAIAATAIHYFNATIKDTNADEYSFNDHTKHWGELKGFLLALQFNPRSQVSDADLQAIHELVGVAPVFPGEMGVAQYLADLVSARNTLAAAYEFDAALIGDDFGENGW